MRSFKITLLTMLLVFTAIHVFGQEKKEKKEKKWSHSVGIGLASSPLYLGDDKQQITVFPNYRLSYNDQLKFSMFEGLSYEVRKNKAFNFGPVLRYNFGRQEDTSNPLRISGNDTDDLVGFGDVEFTLEPGAFVQYNLGATTTKLEVRQGIGGHEGLIGELSSEYKGGFKMLGLPFYYSIGPEIKIANSRYHNAFFGVNELQAQETGLQTYDADFGTLSYGLNGALVLPVSRTLSTVLFAGYSRLGDAASDSQLIQTYGSSNQTSFGILLNYTFR